MKKVSLLALVLMAPMVAFATNYTFSDNTNLTSLSHGTAYTWGLGSGTSSTTYSSLLNDIRTSHLSVTSATLTISNIYDWQIEPADVLYINILGGLNAGVSSYTWTTPPSTPDTSYGPDAFVNGTSAYSLTKPNLTFADAATNSLLKYTGSYNVTGTPGTWSDPSTGITGAAETASANGFNLVINFSAANLTLLQSLLSSDSNGATNPNVGLGFGPDCHYYDSGVTLTISTGVPDSANTLTLVGLSLLALRFVADRRKKRLVAA
jgi:hypothetical protein